MRRLVLLMVVGLAGAGVAVLPSLGAAQATSASFVAVDGVGIASHNWSVAGTTTNTVTIAPGGTVSFSYPGGPGVQSVHNAVFTGPQPSACTQTAAPPPLTIQPAPPLPYMPEGPGWAGSCRFDAPGTYPFQDALYGPSMSGTVIVATATTTPPATTTAPTTTTPPPTTTTFHEPPIPAAAGSLRAASVQRGTTVRGQIHVTAPGSRLIADLFLGRLRVGRTTLHGVPDGTRHFSVALNLTGRRALRAHHRLTLTLRVQVLLAGALGPTGLGRHVTLTG